MSGRKNKGKVAVPTDNNNTAGNHRGNGNNKNAGRNRNVSNNKLSGTQMMSNKGVGNIAAKLELPEGYSAPAGWAKRHTRRRGKQPGSKPTKPWEVNRRYPEPRDKDHSFNYDREVWRSMPNMDLEDEYVKHFSRRQGHRFRRMPIGMIQAWKEKLTGKDNTRFLRDMIESAKANETTKPLIFLASSEVQSADINTKNDRSGLVKVLKITELRRQIVSHLYPSVGDLTSLAMSCKRVAAFMRGNNAVWDLWRPVSFDLGAPGNAVAETIVPEDDAKAKFQNPNLVITSITGPSKSREPYKDEFLNVVRLYKSIQDSGSVLESIVIDQLAFFDVGIFEMMLNTMPNLRTISITRCLLLDITKLKPLLEAVHRHPRQIEAKHEASTTPDGEDSKDRSAEAPEKEEDKSYVQLDFFPFYFHGPQSSDRLGSFGVTYNEPTFNTPRAVIALIMECWDLAKKVGMDLLSESASFWSFVRRLPGPDDLWALKAREALITREYHRTKTSKPEDKVWKEFADDITFAVNGDNQDHPKPPRRMMRHLPDSHWVTHGFWRHSQTCKGCHSIYPVSLFPVRRDVCWGCKMRMFVERMEDSHLRLWLESCMQKWLDGVELSTATLHSLTDLIDCKTMEATLVELAHTDGVWRYFREDYRNPNKPVPAPIDNGWGIVQRAFCPPPPQGIDSKRAALARWRWYHTEPPTSFDYREGGPQRTHPCQEPLNLAGSMDPEVGPEANEYFDKTWTWSKRSDKKLYTSWTHQETERRKSLGLPLDLPALGSDAFTKECNRAKKSTRICGLIRGVERRAQHRDDKEAYRHEFPHVEDCLWSIGTVDRKPFNQDKPVLDPILDKMELRALNNQLAFVLPSYGFKPSNVY